ncbi:hypothetical protein [Streptomyces gardneri]|uniref:hypothetical protein n=1 Tax=Streptomyces gardneri TaxID=66892 RepID=UPI0036A74447
MKSLIDAHEKFPLVLVRRDPRWGAWQGDTRFTDAARIVVNAFVPDPNGDEDAAILSEEDGVFMMEPYSVYAPGGEGVLQWGATEWGDQYFWLLDAKNPGVHPVLARAEGSNEWKRYDVSTAEFLARVLSDPEFQPFGVSRFSLDPSFAYGSDPEA